MGLGFKLRAIVSNCESFCNMQYNIMKLALLNFKDGELQAEALQTNRNVLGFMGDRKSGKDTIDHCTKIMHNMLQSPEELRNEAYCQIMKQTTENPSGESTVLGWKLLAVCLATFPPSDALAPYLGHFCATNVASTQEDGDVKVADVAAFCLKKVPQICKLGARRDCAPRRTRPWTRGAGSRAAAAASTRRAGTRAAASRSRPTAP